MRYLHVFDSVADYNTARESNYSEPWVSATNMGVDATPSYRINYNKQPWEKISYVEIGGLKWATYNVGATGETDYGLYFQWGDTQGYTAEQVGSGDWQKYFGWADYKYSDGLVMTKYNYTDGKTVLDLSDDPVRAAWGGSWRLPTTEEFVALGNAVNTAWTSNYKESGIAGLMCTDKIDSSKVLFFPAAGCCYGGSRKNVGSDGYGYFWSSSLSLGNSQRANYLIFNSVGVTWQYSYNRYYGTPVRGVVGENS